MAPGFPGPTWQQRPSWRGSQCSTQAVTELCPAINNLLLFIAQPWKRRMTPVPRVQCTQVARLMPGLSIKNHDFTSFFTETTKEWPICDRVRILIRPISWTYSRQTSNLQYTIQMHNKRINFNLINFEYFLIVVDMRHFDSIKSWQEFSFQLLFYYFTFFPPSQLFYICD